MESDTDEEIIPLPPRDWETILADILSGFTDNELNMYKGKINADDYIDIISYHTDSLHAFETKPGNYPKQFQYEHLVEVSVGCLRVDLDLLVCDAQKQMENHLTG